MDIQKTINRVHEIKTILKSIEVLETQLETETNKEIFLSSCLYELSDLETELNDELITIENKVKKFIKNSNRKKL